MNNRATILIIDDEAINIEILVELLNGKYELKVAFDGKMGINIAKKVLPDLILLDIEMPIMDGFEVAYELKNNSDTEGIPIIFVTSKTEKEVIISALDCGAVDYIKKPFLKEELFLRVANHVKTRLLQKEINDRNKIQEQLLIQQSKLAAMGEMIGAIAHQWRQPLTALGGILTNIEESYIDNELTENYLTKQIDSAENKIMYMSKTIDDFRNFFVPTKTKKSFCIKKAICNAVNIIDASFYDNNIVLNFFVNHEQQKNYSQNKNYFTSFGYPTEFSQVIINILSNAKDAILEKREKIKTSFEGQVSLDIFNVDNEIGITIKDNAGGINNSIINRVFEPYFTTKEEGKGTGIGLYMSKTIIENNMQGLLLVRNEDDGAVFEIRMKKFDENFS